jgi:deoxyribonuclease-4
MGPAMANLPPLGAHVSVAGGVCTAFERATDLGCDAIQIFVKNASQWRGKELAEGEAEAFHAARAGCAVGPCVAHASYLINLASADPELLERSREALLDELRRCERLGVDALVLHPGAHLGAGEETGIARVAESIDAVFSVLPVGRTRLLLENTAGQGSCLGHRLEELEAIRSRVASPHRVGVCLDTCHAFAAGYAIHELAGWEDFLAEIEGRFGWHALGCFHVNDSVKPFGSRRDRHAHIGAGEIGLEAFARLVTEPRLAAIPMIVETEPGDEMKGHRKDLNTLRRLAGAKPVRSRAKAPSAGSSSGRTRAPRTSAKGSSRSRPG